MSSRGSILNTLVNNLPFELHLPRHNFVMQIILTKINIYFIKTKIYLCKLLIFFFLEWCRFLNVCMQCLVMWPSLWWSRCVFGAVLEPLRRHSAGRIEPSFRWPWRLWACHATNHKKNFTNRFSQFLLQKNQSRWHSKRLDPSTSKGWNSFKSWAAASQPSVTTTARPPFYSSAYPSRCCGSTTSRSLTHLCKLLN